MLSEATKEAIRSAFARLRERLPGYRTRRAQNRMIASVANTLADGGTAAIEAPTGTGKSMAYLIAGVAVAQASDKKLVIATATVALQEQLVRQDIPRYLEITDTQARVALAKGRGRYLCPRNLAHAMASLDDSQMGLGFDADLALWDKAPAESDKETLRQLDAAFDHQDWDGDLDDPPAPISPSVRALVTTTAGGCTGRKCAYFMQCPFFAARRKVDDADIIVANQDLVLSDLTMPGDNDGWGGIILPRPDATLYIIDEGHHLPDKAIERGATHVPMDTTRRQLGKLARQMVAAYSLTEKERLGRLDVAGAEEKLQALIDLLQALENDVRLAWTPDPHVTEPGWRASLGELPDNWIIHARALAALTAEIAHWLAAVRRAITEMTERGPTREALAREFGIALERVERQARTWETWGSTDSAEQPPHARWITLGGDGQLICHASSVSAAALLRTVLWGNAAGTVLTSATLSVGGNFGDFADAVGLPDDALTESLPSPFDLARQATLEVPVIHALPNEREDHAQAVSAWLDAHLDWDAGNLVLFTSRAKLARVLQLLPIGRVRKVRAQGSRGKAQLVAAHVADIEAGKGSTLFGLASFGEGLDLPGKLCETVVVTQLPFAVPTDPVGATYAEWLEARGRNPFLEVSLPQATRLLTQYCGRLIRNEDDRGRIVLLDRRVITRRYGSDMLRALPPFRRVIEHAPGAPTDARQTQSI